VVKADEKLYLKFHDILKDIAGDSSYSLSFTIQPLGEAAVKKSKEHGGNVLNISPESQSCKSKSALSIFNLAHILIQGLGIMVQWTDDKDDDEARSKLRQLLSSIESASKEHGKLLDFLFMNDSSYLQSPLKGYGEESLELLRKASREWDPEGVFQKLQNSGFLLSKV